MKKFVLYYGIIVTLFGLNCSSVSKNRPENVILIIVDTLRHDHLGCYGYRVIDTPNIDGLAEQGIRFEEAVSHVPITLPSISSILTSLTPYEHGVHFSEGYRLQDDVTTLAEVLSAEGFETAAFVSAVLLDSVFGIDQGFDLYDSDFPLRFQLYQPLLRSLEPVYNKTQRRAEDVTSAAISWLEGSNRHRFFMLIHYFDPHIPYDPPPPFVPDINTGEYWESITKQVEFYDAEIVYTDHQIGLFLQKLRELDLIDKSLIVFTSDHGEALGDKDEDTHSIYLYEPTIRVPLILGGALGRAGGKVIHEPVRLIDIYPTILELLRIGPPEEISGKSMITLIENGTEDVERPVYLETYASRLERGWSILKGIRVGNWKYIKSPIPELYNLDDDGDEVHNRNDEEADIVARLEELLVRMEKSASMGVRVDPVIRDDSLLERVRSLGYAGIRKEALNFDIHAAEGPDPKEVFPEFKQKQYREKYLRLALTFITSNRLDGAKYFLERIIELDPDNIEPHFYLAEVFRLQGFNDLGMKEIERVLQLEPDNADAYYTRGLIASQAGEEEMALTSFDKAIELKPDHAEAYNNLGLIYGQKGDYDRALSMFEKAIEVNPDLAQAHANIGNVHSVTGRSGDAAREWELALTLDPAMKEMHLFLGNAYFRDGKYEEALNHYESFLETNPDPFTVNRIQSWMKTIQEKMNDVSRSIRK
jgi:arylsulfatase A-like enzyme/Tfp pilus assembly protein PilF